MWFCGKWKDPNVRCLVASFQASWLLQQSAVEFALKRATTQRSISRGASVCIVFVAWKLRFLVLCATGSEMHLLHQILLPVRMCIVRAPLTFVQGGEECARLCSCLSVSLLCSIKCIHIHFFNYCESITDSSLYLCDERTFMCRARGRALLQLSQVVLKNISLKLFATQ